MTECQCQNEELFLVKEVGGTTIVALKLRNTESLLMQRMMGTLSLLRDEERHAENEARKRIGHDVMDFTARGRLRESWRVGIRIRITLE